MESPKRTIIAQLTINYNGREANYDVRIDLDKNESVQEVITDLVQPLTQHAETSQKETNDFLAFFDFSRA